MAALCTPRCFAGTYWEVQDTLLEDIDRIEVIRGPGGTIWGPNAVDGVINIITKRAKDSKGTLISAGGGSLDQGFLNARYGGSYGDKLNYRVYGKPSLALRNTTGMGETSTIGAPSKVAFEQIGTAIPTIPLRFKGTFTISATARASSPPVTPLLIPA